MDIVLSENCVKCAVFKISDVQTLLKKQQNCQFAKVHRIMLKLKS